MINLPDDKTLVTLPHTFICPHCHTPTLFVEIDEWEDDGAPGEHGVHVSCLCESDDGAHWHMPYTDLMPVEGRAYQWCAANVRIVESEATTRARLAAWNAGEPIRWR